MTAKIVALTNQKGGTGKTTTAMTLAAALGVRGLKVLVVDADPQGSATRWYSLASDDAPFPATVVNLAEAKANIGRTLKDHLQHYDLIVIDCPPHLESPVTVHVMMVADLAIAPVIPSAIDTWATEKLLSVVQLARAHNQNLMVRAMLNGVRSTVLAKTIATDLKEDPVLELLPAHLSLRTSYCEAPALGVSVYGTNDPRAATEANKLGEQVLQILSITAPKPAPTIIAPTKPAAHLSKKQPKTKPGQGRTRASAPKATRATKKKTSATRATNSKTAKSATRGRG
jgi:chromosome partitioning protein